MLRDKSLIPLSRQHQHALALCVRIDRASPVPQDDLAAWQSEIVQHFAQEVRFHFAAEESVLFPGARQFAELGQCAGTEHVGRKSACFCTAIVGAHSQGRKATL